MKRIMILGASILQLPAIIKAKKMGLQTVAVDIDKNAIGFKYADVCLEISTINIPKVVEAAKHYKVNGIMTLASDMPIRTVAAVAKERRIVGISEETALKATNKAIMRECLKEHGVPIPKFFRINSYDDYLSAVQLINGKIIVKPVDNSGSRGVFLVEDKKDKDNVDHAYKYSKKFSRSDEIIIEEYIEGPEVSVETLSINGSVHIIAITDKLTTGAPEFVEMGHSQPTRLSGETIEQIHSLTISAVQAIGIKNGPSHTEMIITDEGPKVVELGARLGGDNITSNLVPLSTGVDIVKCSIDIALGHRPDFQSKHSRGAAIRYFKTPAGKIRYIKGIREAERLPGIKQISFVKTIGDTVGKINCSVDRIGYVIAQGTNANEAITICERVLDCIKIKMEN